MKTILSTFLTGFMFLLLSSCQTFNKEKYVKDLLRSPERNLSNYQFSDSSPLLSRVKKAEPFVLEYLQNMDGRPDYSVYDPTPKERKMIGEALAQLPPLTKKVMQEKCVGIYFINNLYGSGLSDWLVDGRGEIYTILVLNPVTLKMNLSEWLTWKENSAFTADSPGSGIGIDCGKKYPGLYGILYHESTHAVDYVKNINPFVETATLYYDQIRGKKIVNPTDYIQGVWQYANQPAPSSDFPYRKKVKFYTDKKENLIPVSQAAECYNELTSSPFVSLYGSQSWSEDLAEMVMFYHLVKVMGQPYVITVSNGGQVQQFKPLDNARVSGRFKNIGIFYR